MSLLSWLAIALVLGALTDLIASYAARKQDRPYTIYHLVFALLTGWFMFPIGLIYALVVVTLGRQGG